VVFQLLCVRVFTAAGLIACPRPYYSHAPCVFVFVQKLAGPICTKELLNANFHVGYRMAISYHILSIQKTFGAHNGLQMTCCIHRGLAYIYANANANANNNNANNITITIIYTL
jgi:hypothetical protein